MTKLLSFFTLLLVSISAWSIQDPAVAKIQLALNDAMGTTEHGIQFIVTSQTTGTQGVTHYYATQSYQGKQIFGANLNISFKADKLVNLQHSFIVKPETIIHDGQISLKAGEALQSVIQDFAIRKEEIQEINPFFYEYKDAAVSDEPVRIRAKWLLYNKQLYPVWEVSIYELDHEHWMNYRLSAVDGKLLDADDWVVNCKVSSHHHEQNVNGVPDLAKQDASQNSMKADANSSYQVFAIPVESPIHGSRSVAIDPDDSLASPYGWHDTNGSDGAEFTITRGNNVYASEDKNADNNAGNSPSGGSSLQFTAAFDINQSAANFIDASVINLFYWNNLMHDIWYHYGFDEQSGNFQQNNYGRGGSAGDFVRADAQDGSGTNNANFATPPDGNNPRMQMYIWNSGSSTGDYLQVNSPSAAQGKYNASLSAFAESLTATPITADLVMTSPERGCTSIQNAAAVNGKVAYIERGSCTFVEKVRNAQTAGAVAVVIYDSTNNNPIFMGGTASDITIPVVMIKRTDGIFLRNLVSSGVNVSLYDSGSVGSTVFDSDFDAGVISHEYGHGISTRLTGGAANSSCLTNQEQMGEGWSDFFGLVMTVEPGDKGTDVRGIGTYVTNQGTSGGGIRPYPYSTDKSISPYTYNNIKSFSVPHGVGSVWCSMLWDLYWEFVDLYGYDSDIYQGTGGNNMAMQLVMDGLKLQACNPGFEDGRDAILLADQLNNGGANQKLIWEVFAARGLGYSADQGSSSSRSDGKSAFDIPPYYKDRLYIEKRAPEQVNNGEKIRYDLVAMNFTGHTIYNIVLKDTIPFGLSLKAEDIECDASYQDGIIAINLDSIQNQDSIVCSFEALVRLEETTSVLFIDSTEDGQGDWLVQNDLNNNPWELAGIRKYSGAKSWYVDDVTTSSDQSLIHEFEISGTQPVLSFYHYYNTEANWDGGVLEIGVNGSWIDAEAYFLLNGYNATIQVNQASAISGREAFSGNAGHWLNTKVDLSEFIDSTISIRFRFASDGAAGGDGWYIDNIAIEDAVKIENALHASYDPDKEERASASTFIEGEGLVLSIASTEHYTGLQVYPNPASEKLNIEWEGEDNYQIDLKNLNGQTVLQKGGKGKSTLDISALPAGVYFLELSTQNEHVQYKVVVE